MPGAAYGDRAADVRRRLHDPAAARSSRCQEATATAPRPSAATCKGKLSLLLYGAAIRLAFVNQWIADAIYRGPWR